MSPVSNTQTSLYLFPTPSVHVPAPITPSSKPENDLALPPAPTRCPLGRCGNTESELIPDTTPEPVDVVEEIFMAGLDPKIVEEQALLLQQAQSRKREEEITRTLAEERRRHTSIGSKSAWAPSVPNPPRSHWARSNREREPWGQEREWEQLHESECWFQDEVFPVSLDPKVVEEQARLLQQAQFRMREHDLQCESARGRDRNRDLYDSRHREHEFLPHSGVSDYLPMEGIYDETPTPSSSRILDESYCCHVTVSQPPPPPVVFQKQRDEWDFTIRTGSTPPLIPSRQTSCERRDGETRGTLDGGPPKLG